MRTERNRLEVVVGGAEVRKQDDTIPAHGWPESIQDLARYKPAQEYLAKPESANEKSVVYDVIPPAYDWAA